MEDVTTTDNNGNYIFDNVEPGEYCIEFVPGTLPTDFIFTQKDATNDDEDSDVDATGKTEPFTVTNGQDDDLTFDAGVYKPAKLGDFVWEDLNADGIQDPNEPGIDGVTVMLLDGDGNMIDQTTTTNGGAYEFDELAPGDSKVKFPVNTAPNGDVIKLTDDNEGTDEAKDSDATPMPGTNDAMSEVVTLSLIHI